MRVSFDEQDAPDIPSASRKRISPMSATSAKVNPGVRNGTRTYVSTVISSPPWGGTSSVTYNGNLAGFHKQHFLSNNPLVNGKRANSAYVSNAIKVEGHPFDYRWWNFGWQTESAATTDCVFGYGPPSTIVRLGTKISGGIYVPDFSINVRNRMITECLVKLQDSKFNILVSLAEAQQSIEFISATTLKIVRSLKQVRRGNWMQAIRILTGSKPGRGINQNPAGAWLQWQYAVIPLVSDIQGAYEAFNSDVRKKGQKIEAVRRLAHPYPFPSLWPFVTTELRGGVVLEGECKLVAHVSNETDALMNSLGLLNPLLVLWEKTPYSFVIDWLVPIGTWLEGLSAPIGLVFNSGYITTKSVADFTVSGHLQNQGYAEGNFPSISVKAVHLQREPLLALPVARLYYKSPFSTSHVTSAIALLAQLR